ncbi:hypothetical protein J1N10_13000 [Carboxylicivirga sp. A043]|uniref:hypothetical protein n=1 Tax=Carboxylicivirga litoralis TaxID=2816963 RepID=UPI0021CB810E|nr:hypothetical protein [Carboxylicivirga sp. A043]MCU4156899.1 hypothetical protein [Carboxylicivirga sp. A043]
MDRTISMAMSSLPDPGDGEPELPGGATTPPTRIFKQNTFVEVNPFESSPFN